MTHLLPCPFCGGSAIVEQIPMGLGSSPMHRASCESCGCSQILYADAADAIEAWNDRLDYGWQPIETKPPFVECEERGVYTDAPGGGLFYFKATHWRPGPPILAYGPISSQNGKSPTCPK